MNKHWIVVTTINPPTEAVAVMTALATAGWRVVVIGDLKTPPNWTSPGIDYVSVPQQRSIFGELAEMLPYNHYCRKNLGYLYAIARGAKCILETDDDNIPYDSFGKNISERHNARQVEGARWINIYKYFTNAHIWPRGLPLDEIKSIGRLSANPIDTEFPIQQFLADLDPDVDAVFRLVFEGEISFEQNPAIALQKGCWTPFNSQNTLFFDSAFPLLYLPCHVSFRMTDIWRSFVAQQALWIFDKQIAFLPATVKQIRNQHSLMRDFVDEIPGYLHNKTIIEALQSRASSLTGTMKLSEVTIALWSSLNEVQIINDDEMRICRSWLSALNSAIEEGSRR